MYWSLALPSYLKTTAVAQGCPLVGVTVLDVLGLAGVVPEPAFIPKGCADVPPPDILTYCEPPEKSSALVQFVVVGTIKE